MIFLDLNKTHNHIRNLFTFVYLLFIVIFLFLLKQYKCTEMELNQLRYIKEENKKTIHFID